MQTRIKTWNSPANPEDCTTEDKTLNMPALTLPCVQINMRARELPSTADNGVGYLNIPLGVV
jgi:hypothetical protein